MTFSQFLSILRARWKACIVMFFGTIAIVLVVSLVLPKRYKAEGSVVVDVQQDPISAGFYGMMMNPAIVATQIDILTSDRVARRVIHNLKLDQDPQVRQQWQDDTGGAGTIESWLGNLFQRQLDVKPSRESNVITVTYKAADPKFAAGMVNAFMQAYIDTALELRVDPAKQYSSFFVKQAKDARDKLEAAQSRLSEYQLKNGIVATDERFDVESARLNELATQLVLAQGQSADSSSRQTQAGNGNGDRMQEALNNGVIQGIKVDLARAEARLKELSSRYGDNYPDVQTAKASVAETRERLDAETRRITSSMSVSNHINQSREAQVRAQLDQQRTVVLKLKEQRDQAAVLQRDVDNAQRVSEAISLRLNQSSLESQAQQSNVSVLSPATEPLEPSFPKLILNLLVSVFLGALLAVATALIREVRDRRVRSTNDLVSALGLPILGVLPRPILRKRGGLPSLMAQRVISGRLAAPEK